MWEEATRRWRRERKLRRLAVESEERRGVRITAGGAGVVLVGETVEELIEFESGAVVVIWGGRERVEEVG